MTRQVRTVAGGTGALVAVRKAESRRRRVARASIGAIASVLPALSSAADPSGQHRIGRLFSSPEQRVELDRMRGDPDFGKETETAASVPESDAEAMVGYKTDRASAVRALTLNGIVVRGDGHRVAWVNGIETEAGSTDPGDEGVAAAGARGVRVRIGPPKGRVNVVLKPGQTVDMIEGRVFDAFEHRSTAGASVAPAGGTAAANPPGEGHGGVVVQDTLRPGVPGPAPPGAQSAVADGPPAADSPHGLAPSLLRALLNRVHVMSAASDPAMPSHASVSTADNESKADGNGVR